MKQQVGTCFEIFSGAVEEGGVAIYYFLWHLSFPGAAIVIVTVQKVCASVCSCDKRLYGRCLLSLTVSLP